MTQYVLGIDGGGTHTRAAIVDERGFLLGTGVGGPSNYDDVGADAAQANIKAAITQAWNKVGMPPRSFDAAFLGMAGVVSEKDHLVIQRIAANLNLAPVELVGVDHDCRVALSGGLSGRPGIVLIAGTGSSCYGRNQDGESWRAGGWGELISDEGSGYWLGVQAMVAAVRAFDGRSQTTVLYKRVMEHLQLQDINEIMHLLYSQGVPRAEIAEMALLVLEAAQSGDQVAHSILLRGAQDLANCVYAVASRLRMEGQLSELVLIGGLMNAEKLFVTPLKTAVGKLLPLCKVTYPEMPPEFGACILGLEMLGKPHMKILLENRKP